MRSTAPLFSLAAASLLMLIGSPARADVTLSIDLDLQADGIQSEINVVNGASITGAVVLNVSGPTRFSAYDFFLDFEQNSLTFGPNTLSGFLFNSTTGARDVPVDTNRVNLGAAGLISTNPFQVFDLGPLTEDAPLVPPVPDTDPVINSFGSIGAASFGTKLGAFNNGGTFVPFNAEVYQFTLTATNEGTSMLMLREGQPPFLEEEFLGVVTLNTGLVNVTAVPEPATYAACSLGLVIVAFRHRRKRQKRTSITGQPDQLDGHA